MRNNILLCYPPGKLYERGEDRCQANVSDTTSGSMRACNDLGYCAAVLEQLRYSVLLQDYQTERKTIEDVFSDLKSYMPDLVMISVTNTTIFEDIRFSDSLKNRCPDCIVVLKGAIFYDAEPDMLDLLDLTSVSFLIGGEAELAIGGIAEFALHGSGDINTVDNILYKSASGEWIKTKFYKWYADLDSIPFPARKHMNNRLYVRPDTNEPMATIQTSRGCGSACIYCLSPHISGKTVRYRSIENVIAEIEDCYYQHNIHNFFFRADTFTLNLEWAKELCRRIISSPLHGKIEFTANSRTNPLDKEVLSLMKQAGCFAVAFGFESGSDATLKRIKKGITKSHNLQAAKWAHEIGLPIYGFFMIGFPWETLDDIEVTRSHIFEINADFIEVSFALPFRGTELYNICKADGTLSQEVLGGDYFMSSVTGTQSLTNEELIEFRKRLFRSYYLRPSYILRRMKDCIRNPKIFLSYTKYGVRLIFSTFKR